MSWRAILIGVGLVVGGGLFLWFLLRADSEIKNAELNEKNTGPILFFGDSLVEGVGSSQGKDMPSQLSLALKEPVFNYGIAGDTTERALLRIDQAVAEKPRLAIVLLGGNDFLRKIPREQTAAHLEEIITKFQARGAVVLLLGVRSGIVGGGSDDFYETIAKKTQAAYEEDVLKGVFGNQSLMSDAIHPNDAGYAKIIERLLPVIEDLLDK